MIRGRGVQEKRHKRAWPRSDDFIFSLNDDFYNHAFTRNKLKIKYKVAEATAERYVFATRREFEEWRVRHGK